MNSEKKRVLRAAYAGLRRKLHTPERDAAVARVFLASPYAEAESFFLYRAVRTEAGTEAIASALTARGKRVCYPFVEGREMTARFPGHWEEGPFGIPQPCGGGEEVCAVALVPLLAYDGEGYRLGYGGGYYDRYFAAHPAVLRVGIAYAGQACKALPREETDVPLHAVVTENGIKVFRST